MAWRTLTADDVKSRLTGAEFSAAQTAALAAGQSDPLPGIITQVTDEIRGYVAAGGFALEVGATIPSKLIGAAADHLTWRFVTRLPVQSLATDERKSANEAAIRLFERVADKRFAIEEATTVSTEAVAMPKASVKAKTLTFRREDQDGI